MADPPQARQSKFASKHFTEVQLEYELAALNEIGWALSQSLDLDKVLELALESTLRVMDSQAGCIHLPAEVEANELHLRFSAGLADDFARQIQVLHRDDPRIRSIVESDIPAVVLTASQAIDVESSDGGEQGLQSDASQVCISFPLIGRGQLQGLMGIFCEELTPDRSRLLQVIGQYVGLAIEDAQLYRRAQQDARRLRWEAGLWQALNRVAIAASSARSEQEVYDAITRALSTLGFSVMIASFDSETRDLTVVSTGTPFPRMAKAVERLTGLSLDGYQLPHAFYLDWYRDVIERNQAQFIEFGVEPIAQILPEPFSYLAPRIVERAGLDRGIAAPLRVNEQVIALLQVSGGELSAEDVPSITAFADQASAAVENARLMEAERRQRQVAEMLRDLVVTVSSTLDLGQVLDTAVHRLQVLHSASACSVSFLEEGGETFVFRATTDPGIDVSQHITFPAEKSVAGRAIRECKVQIVNDVEQSADYRADVTQRTHLEGRSLLTAPLFAKDRPLGVIQVLSASPDAFSQADADLLTTTAALIETAVARAQAYTQAVELARSEHHLREVAETLRQVAVLISASLDMDKVLGRILEQLAQVVDYDSTSLTLVQGDKLVMQAIRGFENPEEVLSIVADIAETPIFEEMRATRRPVVISDVTTDDRYQPWPGTQSIRSYIGVPLVVRDQVIGHLSVDKRQPDYYDEHDAELVYTFAQQAAVAVENARLHRALQEYTTELEARVEARTAEVSRERERLLAVLENAGDAIAITNATGIVEYANPAWEGLTGQNVAQAVRDEVRILGEATLSEFRAARRSPSQRWRVWRSELTGKRPDGEVYAVDLTITPILDGLGEVVNLVIIYRDVTKYKELDRIKSEFLSTAAHELRSPLTSILGFSELLLTRPDLSADERMRFMDYIYDHATHLKQLVDDLLDISRIEAGASFTIDLEPLDLHPLFKQELEAWQEAHPDHTYVLQTDGDTAWPKVRADEDRIRQVISNLLSNATKYSPNGGSITLAATPIGGYLEVTVADEGIGMSEDELAHIFEKFWRADASSTASEGTGLGLVIVKYIVEQHSGQVWVKSAKGKGTVVHFTLPLAERSTTVLIVDDEEPVLEIEQRILNNNGIATLQASKGKEAIELARTHRPDLILLDLMMPDMAGQDVLRTLKSDPATGHIKVLVVSAHSSWQTIEETYMLGAVDFLTKPFEYEELLSRVRRALKVRDSG